jgi:hypothetical protein
VKLNVVLTAVNVKSAVLHHELPCSFMSTCRRFEGMCCLHLQNRKQIPGGLKFYWIFFQTRLIFTILNARNIILQRYYTYLKHLQAWLTEEYNLQVDVFLLIFNLLRTYLLTLFLTYFSYLLIYFYLLTLLSYLLYLLSYLLIFLVTYWLINLHLNHEAESFMRS